jgi:Cupin superfamily protein
VSDAGIITPLASWWPDARHVAAARRRLGPAPILFPPRDRAWHTVAPGFSDLVRLAHVGLPFQIAAERRYDRSGRAGRLRPALRAGKTVFFPQIHQILPRVTRLMVALRVAMLGTGREECSFLFLVDGRGREGLGLHHDGDVHSFWLQLVGRRTVTTGPPVAPGTPQELPDDYRGDVNLATRALAPGTLFYLPPRTPHRVLCYERSIALSLTWSEARARAARRQHPPAWDLASGYVTGRPSSSRKRVWTQVPTLLDRTVRRPSTLLLPDHTRIDLRGMSHRLAQPLALMASFPRASLGVSLATLEAHGVVAEQDLPLVIVPARPKALDGWRFA